MEWVVTTGKTVDEAREAALDTLGVDKSDAEFEVLEEPRPGWFGRTKGEARVRARVRLAAPPPKRPTRPRERGAKRGTSRGRGSNGARRPSGREKPAGAPAGGEPSGSAGGGEETARQAGAGDAARSAQGRQPSRRGSTGRRPRSSEGSKGSTAQDGSHEPEPARPQRREPVQGADAAEPNGGEAVQGDRTRRGGRGAGQQRSPQSRGRDRAAAGASSDGTTGTRDEDKEGPMAPTLTVDEEATEARNFLTGLLEEFGLTGTVTTTIADEETIEIAVDGPELGLLIGPRGATLSALHEIVRAVLRTRSEGDSRRIRVDVAGYRARRAEALARFITGVANTVVETGQEQVLEPMPANDRKVVHDAAKTVPGVATRSEGEEPRRYVVIYPAEGELN